VKDTNICPSCGGKGKRVPLITLKSLLNAASLEMIEPESLYAFCPNSDCNTVYFNSNHPQTFEASCLKVPVFQKNLGMEVPVCYCFDWTRERLVQAVNENQHPIDHIKGNMKSEKCKCEVNNPQGTCCLGNVSTFVQSLSNESHDHEG
jgi:hypothetical protein